jgi:hypothetical protein
MLTREAIEIYFSKLTKGGAIAFNINSYYDLRPVLSRAAKAFSAIALIAPEYDQTSDMSEPVVEWVVLTRNSALAERLRARGSWKDLKVYPQFRLWTDDYSDPLSLIKSRLF